MNRQEFVDALRQKLLNAGFPDEYVSKQCTALLNRLLELPDSTAEGYTTEPNLDIVVKKLIAQDGKQFKVKNQAKPAPQAPASALQQARKPAENAAPKPQASSVETTRQTASAPKSAPRQSAAEMPVISDSDVEIVEETTDKRFGKGAKKMRRTTDEQAEKYVTCEHPKLLTALLFILCAPTIFLLLAASFGIFAAVFIALAAAILAIVVIIIGLVGGGSVISVMALLYGATQVISPPRYVGLHEIGFGLLAAGITMAVSILLYNVAVRLIPFLFQKIAILSKLFVKKLTGIAKNAVKGCEQL